jgi:outer membrane receptor protein involved in Fe transport
MTRLLFIILILLAAPCLYAATIKGKLLDENNEPLVGAHVYLKDNSKYTIVGMDGSFTLHGVPTGKATIVASFVGYAVQEREINIAQEDEVIMQDFHLEPDQKILQEIVVSGSFDQGSDRLARKSEREANSVINIVSAKTIELSPDITVANVAQRVSGVSILRNSNGDPQYAVVRGMDKRYNYTLVNGIKIPSPDNANRYVPLDIFPAALLDRLEVSKALTPHMEGDAIGGVINMVMKSAPDELMIKGDLQFGYNQINLERKFLKFDHSVVNYKSPYEQYGSLYRASFSDFTKKNGVTKSIQPIPDVLGSFAIGNRYFNRKLGVLAGAAFQNAYRGTNGLWFGTNTDYLGSNLPILNEVHERTYSTQQGRYAVHFRADYRLHPNHTLKLYTGYYTLLSYQVRDEKITQLDERNYSAEMGNAIISLKTRTRITDQRIFTTSIQGEHTLASRLKVNWSAVHSLAKSNEPDVLQFERNTGLSNFNSLPITVERHMPRTWQHNSDEDYTGYLNIVTTPSFMGSTGELSAGGMYRKKDRKNFFNQYVFDPSPATQTYGTDWQTFEQVTQVILNGLGSLDDARNYKAHENLLDGYVQAKFLLFGKTQVLGGVRVENTDQGYDLNSPTDPDVAPSLSQKYTDVLPSINIKHMPNNRTNIRANYYKAITRPGYFELVPYYDNTGAEGYPEVGNPDLKRVQAHNFDVRWEYFPNAFDQILIGGFYKRIIDPIEYATVLGKTNNPQVQPGNFGTASNWGIEVDYTKFFNKIGIKANYTFTDSRITTTKALRQREDPNDQTSPVIVLYPKQTRPLQGQAKHIGNISLLYKDQLSGTNAQLSLVYTGERIESVSPFLDNDTWVKPFTQLDCSIEQKINSHWELTLKGQNLLNSPYEVIIKKPHQYQDKDYVYQNSSNTTLVRRDTYFQSYRIGVRYNF